MNDQFLEIRESQVGLVRDFLISFGLGKDNHSIECNGSRYGRGPLLVGKTVSL